MVEVDRFLAYHKKTLMLAKENLKKLQEENLMNKEAIIYLQNVINRNLGFDFCTVSLIIMETLIYGLFSLKEQSLLSYFDEDTLNFIRNVVPILTLLNISSFCAFINSDAKAVIKKYKKKHNKEDYCYSTIKALNKLKVLNLRQNEVNKQIDINKERVQNCENEITSYLAVEKYKKEKGLLLGVKEHIYELYNVFEQNVIINEINNKFLEFLEKPISDNGFKIDYEQIDEPISFSLKRD